MLPVSPGSLSLCSSGCIPNPSAGAGSSISRGNGGLRVVWAGSPPPPSFPKYGPREEFLPGRNGNCGISSPVPGLRGDVAVAEGGVRELRRREV